MLARKEEIERARAPGRHKEAETQMKKYPEFLQAVNSQNLPPIPNNKTSVTTSLATALHNNELAAKRQEAMKIMLRSQSNADITNTDAPREFNEDAWAAMLQRNSQRLNVSTSPHASTNIHDFVKSIYDLRNYTKSTLILI